MDLEKTVQEELNGLVEKGVIQELIRNQLTSTIKDILNSSMRSYSHFGKELEKTVEAALKVDFTRVSTLAYSEIITEIINEQLALQVPTMVAAPINDKIKELLSPIEIRTYKLSEIIEKFKEVEVEEREGEMTLVVEETNYGTTHIGFDRNSDKSSYSCEVRFSLRKSDKKIYTYEIGRYSSKNRNGETLKETLHGSFEIYLFNLYAAGVTIEVDEDDCETEYYID